MCALLVSTQNGEGNLTGTPKQNRADTHSPARRVTVAASTIRLTAGRDNAEHGTGAHPITAHVATDTETPNGQVSEYLLEFHSSARRQDANRKGRPPITSKFDPREQALQPNGRLVRASWRRSDPTGTTRQPNVAGDHPGH